MASHLRKIPLSRSVRLVLSAAILVLVAASTPAAALDVHLTTDNDFLAENGRPDDLYTFSLQLDLEGRYVSWRLEERAFTDREVGVRFDETFLTVGRRLPARWLGAWSVWLEAGALHVGEGLLGESVQNRFHQLIGSDEVFLDYVESSDFHPWLSAELDRQWSLRPRLSVGVHAEIRSAAGFKTDAQVALKGRWVSRRGIEVDFVVGPRFTETDFGLLEPHVKELAPAATVEAVLWKGLVLQWSTNRYGTGNGHLGLGFRIGAGRSSRRDGPWREAGLH